MVGRVDEERAGREPVFREVRRVLADHGTCWINLGDSFKGACSDATKKALQHMGVALDLARNDEAIRWEQQEETVDLKPYINAELNEAEQEALKAVWKDTYKFRADAVPQSKEQEALTLIDLFAGTQVEDEAPVPFDNDELSV